MLEGYLKNYVLSYTTIVQNRHFFSREKQTFVIISTINMYNLVYSNLKFWLNCL